MAGSWWELGCLTPFVWERRGVTMIEEIGPWIGCAGWSIPAPYRAQFTTDGSHLARYSRRFPAVEINSSFYRPHRPSTYARWAASVPEHFRFAVKLPKEITHTLRLRHVVAPLDSFLAQVANLGQALGPLLVQLPPSLPFDATVAESFFAELRQRTPHHVVCEPRHPSWFTDEADHLMATFAVARVAADPALSPRAAEPGGWQGLVYFRLHGSPKMYTSSYSLPYLEHLADRVRAYGQAALPLWCIFDNTAAFAATENALQLLDTLHGAPPPRGCAASAESEGSDG